MNGWEFERATRVMARARDVVDAAASFEDDAPGRLGLPDGFRTAYADARNGEVLIDLVDQIDDAAALAPRLASALDRTDGWNPIHRLGLLGSDAVDQVAAAERAFARGDIDDAREALDGADARLDDSTVTGALRGLAVLLLLGTSIAWVATARTRRRAANAR
mgnify:CR=1 FL=1